MSVLPPELADRHLGAKPVVLDPPRAFHLPTWGRLSDVQRIKFLRDVATRAGRDPRIRSLAFQILQSAGADQRQYEAQAAALHKWVQANMLYVNEPGEIIQDPLYTLDVKAGDCDDLALLLASMFEAINLPWKYVLSTQRGGKARRWVEGEPMREFGVWQHIYLQVGWPPFRPNTWAFVEPTVKTAPLGWDVVANANQGILPEMASRALGAAWGSITRPLVRPASEGDATSGNRIDWQAVTASIVVSVLATVVGSIALDAVKAWRRKKRK